MRFWAALSSVVAGLKVLSRFSTLCGCADRGVVATSAARMGETTLETLSALGEPGGESGMHDQIEMGRVILRYRTP